MAACRIAKYQNYRTNFCSVINTRTIWIIVRHVLNQVPVLLGLTLIKPFEIVHNSKPDSKKWFELLSIGYFIRDTDNAKSCSKMQSHTLHGIAVGRDVGAA